MHSQAFEIKQEVKVRLQRDFNREVLVCARFLSGATLESIGERAGISRERVRQILKRHGLTGKDGGIVLRAEHARMGLTRYCKGGCGNTLVRNQTYCDECSAKRMLAQHRDSMKRYTEKRKLRKLRKMEQKLAAVESTRDILLEDLIEQKVRSKA